MPGGRGRMSGSPHMSAPGGATRLAAQGALTTFSAEADGCRSRPSSSAPSTASEPTIGSSPSRDQPIVSAANREQTKLDGPSATRSRRSVRHACAANGSSRYDADLAVTLGLLPGRPLQTACNVRFVLL